jgi:ATP-binding cassette subfamily F protein 3
MIKDQILQVEPDLDPDLVDYVIGYLSDSTSDFSSEALTDFLVPLFTNDVTNLIQKFTVKEVDDAPLLLSEKVTMAGLMSNTISFTQNSKVDIRHGSTKIVKSQVDKKKLLLAEKRLALKRAERTVNAEYESAIPTWNPDVKPAIVVNQYFLLLT